MKKFLFAIIVTLLLLSCAHAPWTSRQIEDTRDASYKIKVTMKLDLKPLIAWEAKKEAEREARRKKAEEETRKQFPWGLWMQSRQVAFINDVPVSLSRAQEFVGLSVVRMTDETVDVAWSGTGWVAAKASGRSYIMTAGHVCESKDVYPFEVWDIDYETWEVKIVTVDLPIMEKHHRMEGRDGIESTDATVVRDEDLDGSFNGNDLCMLGVGADLGPVIPVATSEPEYGEKCAVVGAPTGLWGGGVAVASEPLFSGRGSVFGTEPDGLAFNGLLAPGNSGSAVVCDGKAVGVISLGSTRFPSLIHAVPYDRIEVFMRKALHRR